MRGIYVLDEDRNVIEAADLMEWGLWRVDNPHRMQVGKLFIGPLEVSTVFLGVSANMDGGDVFETMVFLREPGAFLPESLPGRWRYDTYEEAAAGHREICERVTLLVEAQRQGILPAPKLSDTTETRED